MKCPPNMVQKVDIQEVVENGVLFKDGSYEQVDSILYCTGKPIKCIKNRASVLFI
jgi:hypothetical protein